MPCQNNYCVYWSDNDCILDEMYLDIQGNCESCIYVDIEESVLATYRKKHLDKFKALQNNYGTV